MTSGPDAALPHVVIVGGGFAGLDAARALARAPVRVTLVDRHNYHLFQPLLYQVATATLSPGDVAAPIRWILRRQRNIEVVLASVQSVDAAARRLVLDRGELSYDYLILAAGASIAYFGHDEWAPRAPGLKTLDDAVEMRREMLLAFEAAERERDPDVQRRLLTFVIVGGGPTGVELAGALAEIARHTLAGDFRHIQPGTARIVLLEGGPTILGTFPADLQQAARRSLERLGVEIRTRAIVTAIDAHGVFVGAERIDAQTILWAAGVAASPLARSLGVPLDRLGRIIVEPTLRVPGQPRIFAAGDIAAITQDGRALPGLAQVAKQSGAHAARNVLRAIRGEMLEPFRYRDYGTMAVVGRGSAVAVLGRLKMRGLLGWVMWLLVHIFWLIGFRNRVAVLIEWAWAYATFQRHVRLITGERLWPGTEAAK